jgi:hypothetical protein
VGGPTTDMLFGSTLLKKKGADSRLWPVSSSHLGGSVFSDAFRKRSRILLMSASLRLPPHVCSRFLPPKGKHWIDEAGRRRCGNSPSGRSSRLPALSLTLLRVDLMFPAACAVPAVVAPRARSPPGTTISAHSHNAVQLTTPCPQAGVYPIPVSLRTASPKSSR